MPNEPIFKSSNEIQCLGDARPDERTIPGLFSAAGPVELTVNGVSFGGSIEVKSSEAFPPGADLTTVYGPMGHPTDHASALARPDIHTVRVGGQEVSLEVALRMGLLKASNGQLVVPEAAPSPTTKPTPVQEDFYRASTKAAASELASAAGGDVSDIIIAGLTDGVDKAALNLAKRSGMEPEDAKKRLSSIVSAMAEDITNYLIKSMGGPDAEYFVRWMNTNLSPAARYSAYQSLVMGDREGIKQLVFAANHGDRF